MPLGWPVRRLTSIRDRVLGLHRSPALEWENFGRVDPYFGVLTDETYRRERLDDTAFERFFETGRTHIDRVAKLACEHVGRELRPCRAMDFGCGVGRLVVPLAERTQEIVGVDVAPSMLAEARRVCDARGLTNVALLPTAQLAALQADFDFIHSYIVFQHIPVRDGYELFASLVGLLAPGGVGVVHFSLAAGRRMTAAYSWVLTRVPLAANLNNLRWGRDWSYPTLEMHAYRLERLMRILGAGGIERASVVFEPATGPSGYDSAVLVFQRPPTR